MKRAHHSRPMLVGLVPIQRRASEATSAEANSAGTLTRAADCIDRRALDECTGAFCWIGYSDATGAGRVCHMAKKLIGVDGRSLTSFRERFAPRFCGASTRRSNLSG